MDAAATSVCSSGYLARKELTALCVLDLGNGEFEPVYATQGGAYPQQPVHYGATNA